MMRHLHPSLRAGLVVLLFLLAGSLQLKAQERVVTGTVRDAETNETLIGVNITAATDRSIGTVTDIDGKYRITVPESVTALTFSYVGYTEQTILVTSSVLDIKLMAGKELSEVVVIGYGTQKTREVTSAVSSVKSEDFNRGNITNPIQLIQGKVAGLAIAKPGSDPNADFNIRLRGLSTFGSNTEPLVIIDGIPGASLRSIDPQDIVSMDVLKDASASAIYGTRAASGVILITTKKGEFVPGEKAFNVEFGTGLTAESVSRTVPVLTADEFRQFSQAVDFGENTDWFKEMTRTGLSQNYNLAVNGADKNSNYRVSVNYRDVDGTVNGTGFNQLNGRLNFTQRALNNKLQLDFNLAATLRNEEYIPSEALRYAVRYNPTAPVHEDTTTISQEWGGYFQRNAFYFYNPIAIIEQNTLDGKKNSLIGGLKGTYEIIKGLKVSAFYSVNSNNEFYGTYYSKYSYWNPYEAGSHKGFAKKENKNFQDQLLEFTGSYDRTINKFSFGVLGGYSYQESNEDNFWAYGEDFLSDEFLYNSLGSASGTVNNVDAMSSYKSKRTLIGFFGRATANYDNGVFLTVNFRRDGSSMFGKNNQWGNFPGVSAGIDIARFVEIPSFNRLKIRGGYGVTGNLPQQPYLSKLLYDASSSNFFYNGEFIQAFGPIRNDNPDLKWETKKELGFGLDFALIDYRLSGSIDYYSSKSSDLIIEYTVPVPPYPVDRMFMNIGEMKNSGLELSLNLRSELMNAFQWSIDLNFTKYFETYLTKLTTDYIHGGVAYFGYLGDPFLISMRSVMVNVPGWSYFTNNEGMPDSVYYDSGPIGQIIAPIYTGIDSTGSLTHKDVDGDGTFNAQEDYEVVGSGLPDFQIGLGGSFSYKGFDLSLFFRGVFGHSLVNVNAAKFGVPNVMGIQSGVDLALDFKDATDGPVFSDVHVEKADFVKLDNWAFGYNFKFRDNKYIQGLRLYLSGQNLFTITNYSGVDPEVRYVDSGDNKNPLAPGVDRQDTYFSTRSFTLGVNVNF